MSLYIRSLCVCEPCLTLCGRCIASWGKMTRRPVQAPIADVSGGLGQQLGHTLPVHHVLDEGFHVVRPTVAVDDVVGMLPHVAAEQRRLAEGDPVHAVRRLADLQLADRADRLPAPAQAAPGDAGLSSEAHTPELQSQLRSLDRAIRLLTPTIHT